MSTALAQFAATLSAGDFAEFTSGLLNSSAATGSRPWEPTAAAAAAGIGDILLDWSTMMDFDPVSKRYFSSGGRPAIADTAAHKVVPKMVIYDEVANEWSSVDAWATDMLGGHQYRSTTVLTQHRLAAYHPHVSMTSPGLFVHLWDIANHAYWGTIPTPPTNIAGATNGWAGRMFLCWFPTMGTDGGLVYGDSTGSRIIWFDWADRASGVSAWKTMTPTNFGSEWNISSYQHFNGHYHPVTDKMIVGCSFGDKKLAIVNSDRTMALTEFICPANCSSSGATGGPFMPHATLPLSILFDRADHHIWTYDWRIEGTGVTPWEDRGLAPSALRTDNVIGLPHPSGGGFMFCEYGATGASKTYYWKPNYS